jgi:hypothetical protein
MSKAPVFTLIVPELRDAPTLTAEAVEWRQLARLAGRGTVQRIWRAQDAHDAALRPWQHAFLTALGLQDRADLFASAPISVTGAMSAPASGYWMHAELVHFAASLDDLAFVPLRADAAVLSDERAELQSVIEDHLRAHGLTLHTNTSAGWMVAFERRVDASTCAPDAAARSDLAEAMPQGADAGMLRRLMTECQMLLHDHPVNARRAARELPAINALWLWGGGELAATPSRTLPVIVASDPYAKGLAFVHGRPSRDVPSGPGALACEADMVVVAEPMEVRTLEEQWLAPLMRAVSQGSWGRLDVMIEGWRLSVDRASLWRFWRRPRPPLEWVT